MWVSENNTESRLDAIQAAILKTQCGEFAVIAEAEVRMVCH